MILRYSPAKHLFCALTAEMAFEERHIPQAAGFSFIECPRAWVTPSPYVAAALYDYADEHAERLLLPVVENVKRSQAITSNINVPALGADAGCEYLEYQKAGVENICSGFQKSKSVLLADPMGVGKTMQAIGAAVYAGFDPARVLVICPASLRLNWAREIRKWTGWDVLPVLTSKASYFERPTGPTVVSYNLASHEAWADMLSWHHWELIVLDEAHYIKNPEAVRTQRIMGQLADAAEHVLLMSGTPIPNSPMEFHPLLYNLRPDVIDGMSEWQFQCRFTAGFQDTYGWRVTGTRNEQELYMRLRGSGWMTRREKSLVLPQLPPKRHNLVVFPQDRTTAEIIKAEREHGFDAAEILRHGQPLGVGVMPELRRLMGEAKVPECVEWLKVQLDGGLEKVVVFCHHTAVAKGMAEGLAKYSPLLVIGETPMGRRQAAIDRFQTDPDAHVIIGSWEPLGVGWTLTAADTVVFVESSWVPKDNDQAVDRIHRIGQEAGAVFIYHLVVEGSTDASVLSAATKKGSGIMKCLDGK